MAAVGEALSHQLFDFHLSDVGRVVAKVMTEHSKACDGCSGYPTGAYDLVMAELLINVRAFLGDRLEELEIRKEEAA